MIISIKNILYIFKGLIISKVLIWTILAGSFVPAYAIDGLYHGGYSGTWIGKLLWINPSSHEHSLILSSDWLLDREGMDIKILVDNDNTKVFFLYKGLWREIKAGKFVMKTHKTNAVLFALDSSIDVHDESGAGGWVETWNYTLTYKDANHLYVYFVRVVNNYLRPYNYKDKNGTIIGRFFRSAFGELEKIEKN